MEDVELIKKVKKGDGNSFSKLIMLYEKDLYRVAISIMKNDDDALDCIQDAILSAYNSIKKLSHEKFFKTWLIRILVNKCNDSLKKKQKVIPYGEIPSKAKYDENTEKLDIRDALEDLEQELKIIVVLYYYEDMSIKDIAETLNIPEGTVKSRLSRARNKLKDLLAYSDKGVI